jgi:hypothetical protein
MDRQTLNSRVATVFGVETHGDYASSWDALMPDLQAWLCREDPQRVGSFWFALSDRLHASGKVPSRNPEDPLAFRRRRTAMVAVALAVAAPEDVCYAVLASDSPVTS